MQDILINWTPQETRVALVEDGVVQELHIERTLERGRVGNIYKAKVLRVLPGMQSAFLDIGFERAAFLHVADLYFANPQPINQSPLYPDPPLALPLVVDQVAADLLKTGSDTEDLAVADSEAAGQQVNNPVSEKPKRVIYTPIEKLLVQGQTVMVQVMKDPIGSKGARLTSKLTIAGRLLVFLPFENHLGISQKIGSHQLREALRSRLAALAQGSDGSSHGGFILRTNAEEATDEQLAEDIAYLRKTWSTICEKMNNAAPGTILYEDLNLAQRVLRDMVNEQTNLVQTDAATLLQALKTFGQSFTPSAVGRLSLYQGDRSLFDLFNIEKDLAAALERRVPLKSGGHLIIDQTEALTTIDVNTGGYVGQHSFDETIYRTNLEAAQTIARQLRLRNLGGVIIIDFIDMVRHDHRHDVLTELRKQLSFDRTKISVSGYSHLGLVEMTRKRTRESLAHILCAACPRCHGAGQIKRTRTICYDILREIQKQARQFNPKEFRIIANPEIIDLLEGEENQYLQAVAQSTLAPISLFADTSSVLEVFDILLIS